MNKKNIAIALAGIVTLASLVGCSSEPPAQSAEAKDAAYQRQIEKQAQDTIGMPEIKNFFMKKTLKKVLELQDNPKLVNYAYLQAYDGHMIYLGNVIGYGVSGGTQYTSPEKAKNDPNGSYDAGSVILPQADPDGLYRPGSASATSIIYVDWKDGTQQVATIEPDLMVFQTKVPKRLVASWSIPSDY